MTQIRNQNDRDPLIRDVEGAAILGCSKATFWRRVADGGNGGAKLGHGSGGIVSLRAE